MIKGTKLANFKGKVLQVLHNTEPSPPLGDLYGQSVEPGGYFCIQDSGFTPEGWKASKIKLNSPLIIDVSKDRTQWKFDLSKKYNSKKKQLTKKLVKAGYDGIITVDKHGHYKGETGEIIVFDIKKSTY